MPLSDPAVRNAKPADKPYKLTDSDGLYLLVNNAGKYWRYDYRFHGKRKTLAFGVYPVTTLAEARDRRNKARKLIADGGDPGAIKQAKKLEEKQLAASTFDAVAREWHQKQSIKWVPKNAARTLSLLNRSIFPALGNIPIAQVTAASLLSTIQKIESRGNIETAHRAMQICGQSSAMPLLQEELRRTLA